MSSDHNSYVQEAYLFLRKHNNTIPSPALKKMRDDAVEADRLRAELAERDKAVQVAEGLCPTCVDSLGVELARKCPAKPPAHPPRQAVPDGWSTQIRSGDVRLSHPDKYGVWLSENTDVSTAGEALCCAFIKAMLTAAPEARSEADECYACKGSGMNNLSPDPAVIGTATCSRCGGSGKAKPLLTARSEAEIQAEALEKRAASFERRANDLAYHGMSEGAIQSYEKQAAKCRDEAARLREGEKQEDAT